MKHLLIFILLVSLFSCSSDTEFNVVGPNNNNGRNQLWSDNFYSFSEEKGDFKSPFTSGPANGDPIEGVLLEQYLLREDAGAPEFLASVETDEKGNFEFLYSDDERYIYRADLSNTSYNATFGLNTNLNLSIVAFERKETVFLFRSNDNSLVLNAENLEYEFSRPIAYGSLGDFVNRSDGHSFIEENLIANCCVNVNLELKYRMKGESVWQSFAFYRDAMINQYEVWVD